MKKRLLGMLMLTFLIGGGSLFTLAEDITVESTDFPLGTNVVGKWDKDKQTLTMTGQGKIDKPKWDNLKKQLKLTTDAAEKVTITFAEKVQFPDDASNFFFEVKSANIVFHPAMETSNVTNMNNMFRGAINFNTDISAWNTENVITMQSMFQSAQSFNQNLESWNVNKLQTAASMFNGATSFNGDINWENLTKLTSINAMFKGAKNFNKPLDKWNTSTITDMSSTFDGASNFNQDIGMWKTQNVTRTYAMFRDTPFNQNIGNWNISQVTDMSHMFQRNKVFNQDLGNFNTSNVTNMAHLFADAEAFEGKGLEKWNVVKVENMEQTFHNALAFDADLSNWNPVALKNGKKFIHFWKPNNESWKLSFSRENYDKLLQAWENKVNPKNPKIPLTIQAPYCLGKGARKKLNDNTFTIQWDWQDCELKASESENKESKTSIKSTVRISSVLPAKQIKAKISVEKTNVTYKNWECKPINLSSPWEIECSFEVTSTEGGRNLEISYTDTDRVSTKSRTGTYLIDNQGPQLPQVTINTQASMENTTITLKEFPKDIWGAGVAKCHIWYTNSENKDVNYDILDNQLPRTGSIKTLDKFVPDAQGVYTLKIRCEDRLQNKGEANEIKFPPIIEFAKTNITFIKPGTDFEGTFTIYSPSENMIEGMKVTDANKLGIENVTCKWTKNPTQTWEFSEGYWRIGKGMNGANDKDHKIICTYKGKWKDSWALTIQVWDNFSAEGKKSQEFTLDSNPPAITIAPDQSVSSGDIKLTITIFDHEQLNTESITIEGQPLNLDTCTEKKSEKLVCSYTITGPVTNKTITVTAQDAAGYETTTKSWTFTIDTEAPSITNPQMNYANSGTVAKITFTAKDAGVGLRTKTDQENTVLGFDWNAISYGFSENATCNNYQQEAILTPGTAEPFNFEIALNDNSKNGKYVCLQVKDKVWNLTSVSLGQLKINQAPILANTSKEIRENLAVGSEVLTLAGSDPNEDVLTYAITAGDDNQTFSIEGNQIKVNKPLDFETTSTYTLTITVTDPQGLSTTATVTITITDVDEEAPSIDPIKNVTYPLNATITPIVLSGSDNKGITKWEVKDLPTGLGFDEATHSITGTLAAPAGNYQITVIASDADGNKTEQKFTLTIQAKKDPKPEVKPGYSGGGGGSFSLKKDYCPNGDHSASYYDGSCGTQQNEKKPESSDKAQTPVGEKKAYQENDLFNPNIEDGKCYSRRPHLGILTSQLIPTTEEYNKAQSFLWSYEMTKYDSVDGYDPYRYLSRQEAAKIFSNFAINVLCRQPNKKLTINYSDTQDADPSLKPYIELAYQLGIMKGSGQGDGSFRPYEFISKAEVNAVLIRMLLKSYLDETGMLRYTPYNQASHTLNIISQEAGLEPIARNHVALMLFRAYKQQSFDWKEIDYFSYVLKNRADFVK